MSWVKFPKPGKKDKKRKTPEEIEHLSYIASLGCVICGEDRVQAHHIREFGEPRDHFKTIPLCYEHHQGSFGIHHLGKREWREKFGHELEYLKQLTEKL